MAVKRLHSVKVKGSTALRDRPSESLGLPHTFRAAAAQWSGYRIRRILFSDEVHFWLNGYVNKQNCRIWSEANPQVYVETPLHPEKLTVWCALWAGGILLQKR
ncbi:hypothetical protein TNCV_3129581 [Trichonephila clavipes]|nr:hypothetical protein TNCV_3129581 [Trichonephila clavipes]